jgi:hypothetical protein
MCQARSVAVWLSIVAVDPVMRPHRMPVIYVPSKVGTAPILVDAARLPSVLS